MNDPQLRTIDVPASQVYSFDVFDTVLTRSVSPPTAVFILTARAAESLLPPGCSSAQFALLRRQAEQRATSWHGDSVALSDIYCELRGSLQISKERAQHIMKIERAVESTVVYPVPETRTLIARLREQGASIVYTSDMYLSSRKIREWLVHYNLWQPDDRLFVSCEYGATKHNGRLFQLILQEHGEASSIVHVGNNEHADIGGAKAAGLTPHHFVVANPNRYEQILENYARDTGGMSALMAGASRYARLHIDVSSPHEKALRNVAAGVIGPILTSFVLWILQRVKDQGIERLYFTSRDGHVLVAIARRLAPAVEVSCTFRYVHLSRTVVTRSLLDPESLFHTWNDFERASGNELLDRLNVDMEEINAHLTSKQKRQVLHSRPLTERGKQVLRDIVSELASGNHELSSIQDNRRILCDYLDQEGFNTAEHIGFVDLGWRGTIHGLLNTLLLEEGMIDTPMSGFFFGLNKQQADHASYRSAYFFDKYRKTGTSDPLSGSDFYTVMEMFCTADHGTVTGYERKNDEVYPTLEATWPARMEEWGLPVVRQTVDSFLDGLLKNRSFLVPGAELRPVLARLLKTFWSTPRKQEAEAWGDFPRELGQGQETTVAFLATPYKWFALFSFLWYGHRSHRKRKHDLVWAEGALARSSTGLRRCIQIAVQGRRLLRRMKYKTQNVVANHFLRPILALIDLGRVKEGVINRFFQNWLYRDSPPK